MGILARRPLPVPRAFRLGGAAASGRAAGLPAEIAFLREYGVPPPVLEQARRDADRFGTSASDALLAGGRITDTLFYKSLAHHVGVPFRSGYVALDPVGLDPAAGGMQALRTGRVRLADGGFLVAPTGGDIGLLVEAAAIPDLVPSGFAIATPAHLEALVLRCAGGGIARRASLALPSLEPELSARGAADARAAAVACCVVTAAVAAYAFAPFVVATLAGAAFLAAVAMRWTACMTGLIAPNAPPPPAVDRDLPRYSVLVPLSREAGMVPDLVEHLAGLDYPAAKLEILFLVEADDSPTSSALRQAPKPPFMRTLVVPPGEPRTKPRALNVGLACARGDLITVYDAEDRPEPGQLRRAAERYAAAPRHLACLQAHLAITDGNLLQRLFALEYSILFGLYDTGLARLGLPLPLGGTSNHFRSSALRAVGGWDAWNVTEDADLGFRLMRFGYATEMLDSRTWEEAPARLDIWIRQRRRWTKGWMQVALVLVRDRSTLRDLGPWRAASVALTLVGMVVGPLATPIVLAMVGWQACRGDRLAGAPAAVALVVPAVAVLATLCCGWAVPGTGGVRSRVFLPLLLLPNQVLIALAAWGGLWDLVRAPYHWRKTPHGVEALSRSSPAAPRRPRRGPRPATPG